MKIPITSRTFVWLSAAFLSLLIASSTFWIALGLGVDAEEMQYDPVHDSAWFAARAHMNSLSSRLSWTSTVFLAMCLIFLALALRDRASRGKPIGVIFIGTIIAGTAAGILFTLVIGFFIAAGLNFV